MKILKTIITTIILLFSFSLICNAQTEIGIGIVSIDSDSKPIVRFYKNPNDKKAVRTVEFFDDKSINSFNIKNLETQKVWLRPEAFRSEYPAFSFRCKSKTRNWYEVIVNNKNGKSLWIKKERFTKLLSWETYLKNTYVIERLAKYKQPIRKFPATDSTKIRYAGQDCFQVKSMKGEWLEIYTSDFCRSGYGEPEKTTIKSGWIKWKNGNTLLIDYRLAD